MSYTHPPITGKMPSRILPEGTALVLEGGGTRGFYSAGVFEAFMDAGVMFPYIIGVSAGSANALSYISGQHGRNRQIVEYYVSDPRYVSRRNLLRHRSLFGMEFVFHEIPQRHIFWDWDMFSKQDIRFLTGAIDCVTGQTVWFEKNCLTPQIEAVMASCSIPMVSSIVRHKGYNLLDGGISDPIPIEKSISDGNSFHVIVLTQNSGHRKEAFTHKALLTLFYRKYPKLIEAMLNRHEVYNRQLDLCERLVSEGKAVIVRPLKPLQAGRADSDKDKLLALYDEGHKEGAAALEAILNIRGTQ